MRELAFSTQPTAGHEPQGIVVSIGKETADIKAGATRLRNVAIAKPLTAEQLNLYDIVALLWVGDVPHATSILGHESAYRKDPYQDTTPPPFPVDVQVVQTNYGAKLVWAWGGKDSNRGDLAFYEVDARLPGQQWGLDVYPVGEGTSEEHYPRLPHLAVQVRVRAVDLRGNKSNWVEADDLLQDLVAPPAPMGFNVSSEVGGVRCTWISPLPGSIPDLAGFFLYACTDELGTGGIIKAKTVGPTTSTFYEFVYSGTLYFNLTAFDLAGNESDYAVTIWLPGYSYGSQGAQLLINSDFERSMMGWEDIVLGPLPDYWNMVIGNVTYGDIEYGDFGREGGKGIRTAFTGNTSAVIYWPYSGDDGLNVWLLRAEPSQIYTVSIYFKPDCSIDLFRYEYYADLGTLQDLVYLGLVVRRHNGTGIDPTGYDTGTGTLIAELEDGWYRAAFSVMPADNPTYPYICATFVVYNRTGGSVTVDLDRAQVVIGKDPAQWQPGIGGAYGATTGGLRLDMSGLSSDNLKVGKDGRLYSDFLPDETGTRDLGDELLRWNNVHAVQIVADTILGVLTGGEWEHAGDMRIDANHATDRTLTIANDGAGRADVDIDRHLDLGGNLDVTGTAIIGGAVTLGDLTGVGTRMVVADAAGLLSTAGAPLLSDRAEIDGELVVTSGIAYFVVKQDCTLKYVYAYVATPGSAGSTIADVHLIRGGADQGSVFTTQANRPTVAHDDVDELDRSGTPDVVDLLELDILRIDIDAVATGAIRLVVAASYETAAGTITGGGRGVIKRVKASFNRPADTNAYEDGDAISDSATVPTVLVFEDVVSTPGGSGTVYGGKLNLSSNQATHLSCELHLFEEAPTAMEDNAAFDPSDAEAALSCGYLEFRNYKEMNAGAGAAGNVTYQSTGLDSGSFAFTCEAGSTDLHAVVRATNGYVPTSGEAYTFIIFVEY